MITDYDTLKAEVASQVARSDYTSGGSKVTTDISLAEKYIDRELRVTQKENEQAVVTVANEKDVDLNADFILQRNLSFDSSPQNIDYVPLTKFKTLQIGVENSRPRIYTIVNNATTKRQAIRFAPTPGGEYNLTFTYLAKIPTLSDSNTTNWLLEYDEELYLNASLYMAYRRFRNPLSGDYKALVDERISKMNKEDQINKSGTSGSRVRARGSVV